MALIVEDGTGLANAESYDSVAGITTTLAATGEDAAWLLLTTTQKEQIARRATRALDSEYAFRGSKSKSTQALEWPRSGAYDDDWYPYEGVPTKLKQALAQYCSGGLVDLQPDQTSPGSIKSESVSIAGVISESVTYASAKSQEVYYRKVSGLLSELTESAGRLERA